MADGIVGTFNGIQALSLIDVRVAKTQHPGKLAPFGSRIENVAAEPVRTSAKGSWNKPLLIFRHDQNDRNYVRLQEPRQF